VGELAPLDVVQGPEQSVDCRVEVPEVGQLVGCQVGHWCLVVVTGAWAVREGTIELCQ
jgi:hypothetical protein